MSMTLNDYWRGCIEAGPIEPPLSTVAYQMAEMQFHADMLLWEIGEQLLGPLTKLLGAAQIYANDLAVAVLRTGVHA